MSADRQMAILHGIEPSDDLANWVAQLDATQRKAYAAYFQDRIRILDHILSMVVKAKHEGRLRRDREGCVSGDGFLAKGGVPTPGKGSSKAATTPSIGQDL